MFLMSNKRLVVGSLHEFENVVAGVIVFVVDLGVAEEAGVSPIFRTAVDTSNCSMISWLVNTI